MFDLSGKKFLITGASGGIGEAIAKILHNAGAIVCISGTKVEVLKSIANGNVNMHVLPCDLSDGEKVKTLVKDAEGLMSGLDGLVCNAGITKDKLLLRMTDDDWQRVIDINLTVTFKLNRDACRVMTKNQWGRIINISSIVAFTGNAGQSNYAAAKAGMIAMSKSIAQEYASRNITVNCIAPGFIDTNMTASLSEEQKNNILNHIPMKRMGTPEEIAAGVLFLASDEARYIAGSTLHINGGMLME